MNDNSEGPSPAHIAQVDAISKSVYELLPNFAAKDFTPEAVFEGAVKGATVVMMTGRGLTLFEVADMLSDFADGLRAVRDPKRGKLHVVE